MHSENEYPIGNGLPDYVEEALYNADSVVLIAICTENEQERAGGAFFKVKSAYGVIRAQEFVRAE